MVLTISGPIDIALYAAPLSRDDDERGPTRPVACGPGHHRVSGKQSWPADLTQRPAVRTFAEALMGTAHRGRRSHPAALDGPGSTIRRSPSANRRRRSSRFAMVVGAGRSGRVGTRRDPRV